MALIYLTCQNPPETTPQHIPKESRVCLYHYFSGTLSGGIDEMISNINAMDYPWGVTAYPLDHESFKTMINASFAGRNPPDLFAYWAGEKVQKLVDQGKLAPLDTLWDDENLDEIFPKYISDAACTYSGKKYLIPLTQHLVLFYYNKQIFDDAGLTPPKTWDELQTTCQTLKDKGIVPISLGMQERWPGQFWFDYILLRTAGFEYRQKLMHGDAAYTDPEVMNAYKLWKEMLEKGYFNSDANTIDWAGATTRVVAGKSAMTLMGTWATQNFSAEASNWTYGKEYDMFVFPEITPMVPLTALGPIDGIILTKDGIHHEEAQKVLRYFCAEDPQKAMSRGSGAVSPSSNVPLSFYPPHHVQIMNEINVSKQWAFNYDLATPPEVSELGLNSFVELVEFPDQYQAILKSVEKGARAYFDAHSNHQR
ncbi:hypothetical protein BVX99_01045 [bacterium F16]|nr:hypothetical protein BVX99_01045 [bacterium F16]